MIVSSNLTVPIFGNIIDWMQRKNKNLNDRKYNASLIQRFKNEKYFIIHVTFSQHNVHVCVTTKTGDILMRDSGGTLGFLKASRGCYVSFFEVGERIAWQFHRVGGVSAHIWLKGKHRFFRGILFGLLSRKYIKVLSIRNITPISHNGCRINRKRKLRRRRFRKIFFKVTRFLAKRGKYKF